MAVKGSGGDLRSIGRQAGSPCSTWTSSKRSSRAIAAKRTKTRWSAYYPLCAFGENRVAASIDTPLHAFLPSPRRSPASRTGRSRSPRAPTAGEARRVQREVRPTHRLGAVAASGLRAGADAAARGRGRSRMRRHRARRARALHLGRHPARVLSEQRQDHRSDGRVRPGTRAPARPAGVRRRACRPRRRSRRRSSPRCCRICAAPCRRIGASSRTSRRRGRDAFANARWAEALCQLGTSCPDHFLRTRISPLYVPLDAGERKLSPSCRARIRERLVRTARTTTPTTRRTRCRTRRRCATRIRRWSSFPGLGLFGFGKDKREARITSEFFVNAIHVMAGANALGSRCRAGARDRRKRAARSRRRFPSFQNYVALPRSRGVQDRVLGARGSQAAADAAGARVQPQDRRGRRRRQRHRPRGGAADRQARRPRGRRRHERRRAPRTRRTKRRRCRRRRW